MINLWELLVHASHRDPGPAQQRASQAASELGSAACMPWQNISLSPRDEGWVVRIHSTYESGIVEMLIPKDRGQPVRVLEDTRLASRIHDFSTLFRAGRYSEAARVANDALTAAEDEAGLDHPERPRLLYQLAASYMKRGNFHRAEILFEQALDLARHASCFSAAERVHFFSDWALLHFLYRCTTEADYAEAELRFSDAMKLARELLGENHPECARIMTGQARLRLSQFRHSDADQLLTQALQIREQALGPSHEDLAETLLELGRLRAYQDENEEAEAAYRRALTIRETVLGPSHPDVAELLFNLADLYYYNHQQPAEAAQFMLRALDIWEQSLGLEHPLVEREGQFIKTVLPALTHTAAAAVATQPAEMEEFDDDVEF